MAGSSGDSKIVPRGSLNFWTHPEVLDFMRRWGLLCLILQRQDEDKSDEQLIAESDNWERLTITMGGG